MLPTSYDGNGNLLQKSNPNGSEQYTYNGLNQLTHTRVGDTVAKYTYNANGIRISKQVGTSTTDYLLDGGDVVAEYTDGEMTAQFVRGVNLIRGILGPAARYFLHNAHGDVVVLTTTTGTVRKRYDYDAFGNEENPSSTDANPFRYCGEYFDKETKTYYLRARYYDPAIGRFTQQDTHWFPANAIYGDNPRKINERQDALGLNTYAYAPEITAIMQSGNLYVYCVNNPVAYSDSTGEALVISALVLGAFVGSIINIAFNIFGQLQEGKTITTLNVNSIVAAAATGAISGLVAGSAIPVGGQIVINALLSGTESLIQDRIKGHALNVQVAILKALIGGLAGAVGGHGAQYSKAIIYEKITGGTVAKLKYSKVITQNAAIEALLKGLAKSGLIQLIFTSDMVEIVLGGNGDVG